MVPTNSLFYLLGIREFPMVCVQLARLALINARPAYARPEHTNQSPPVMPNSNLGSVRLLVAQYTGSHQVAYETLSRGGEETYYAQRYAISTFGDLARDLEQVGILCCCSSRMSDVICGDRVRSMSAVVPLGSHDYRSAIAQIETFNPTHLIVSTPNLSMIRWALAHKVSLFPMFADSFFVNLRKASLPRRLARAIRHKIYIHKLVKSLNDPRVRFAANHNLNAAMMLVQMGVDPRKTIPWDYEPPATPTHFEPKTIDPASQHRLVFVGSVIPSKGAGDAIRAVKLLADRYPTLRLRMLGNGELDRFRSQAADEGIADRVEILGARPHSEVIEAMHDARLVLVLSWHEYSEAMPFTIYESLITRTPLICSDHPMFRNRAGEGRSAMMVPEKNPEQLASAIHQLLSDSERYARMSQGTATTWDRLQCPAKLGPLIRHWLGNESADQTWLEYHSVDSMRRRGEC